MYNLAIAIVTLALASVVNADDVPDNYNTVRTAHAILLPIAFAIFYPFGSMLIRLFDFRGVLWVHASFMLFTYMIVLAGLGLGVWMAIVSQQVDTYHTIIGMVVVVCLLIQPALGLVHHQLFKHVGRANAATYLHVWWGRVIITLGIINGGMGFMLSADTVNGSIIYGILAGVIWVVWMSCILTVYIKESKRTVVGGRQK